MNIYISAFLVALDVLALGTMAALAYAYSGINLQGALDVWRSLHLPTAYIMETLMFPKGVSMHSGLPIGRALIFVLACVAQTAVVGWVLGLLFANTRR